MSLKLAELRRQTVGKKTRAEILALMPSPVYEDGRTKQCFKDECDIDKIMTRFGVTGTISHMTQYEGVYADFSDYDFQAETNKLARGVEIFDALPAEIRKEFRQSPEAFFSYVNDPANAADLREKLIDLAPPGRQLPRVRPATADELAAEAAASSPKASETTPTPTMEVAEKTPLPASKEA